MFELQAHETPADAIRRIGLGLIDENLHLLQDETGDRDEAIHEARKNFKRLRAVLRLVRAEIGEEVYKGENIVFRDASRRLAVLRDSAVMVETLEAVRFAHAADLPGAGMSAMHGKLVAWQEGVRDQFLQNANTLPEVVDVLQDARSRFAALPITGQDFAAFAGGLQRVYRQGRRRMAEAYATGSAELFHDWRKRVKYLWHQVEILHLLWPTVMDELARELHHLSTLLGDAHDLVVLREMLTEEDAAADDGANLAALLAILQERQAALEKAAFPVGQRIFAERPSAFVQRLAAYWEAWQVHGYNGLPAEAPQTVFVGTQEAAALLGLSVTAVRMRIARGELPAVKVSGVWVIPLAALPEQA